MIGKRTVLVLGAGASADCGFPTGIQLIEKIDKLLSSPQSLDPDFLKAFRLAKIDGFKELRKKLRGAVSIDSFLQFNHQYSDIGKWLIAMALSSCEKEEYLYREKSNWYWTFFNSMKDQLADFGHRVGIITFNYDRSLEYAMLLFLLDNYNNPEMSMCIRQIKNIPIYHIHGHLGDLPGFSKDGLNEYPYGEVNIRNAANNIKIIHDGNIEDSYQLRHAKELIEEAEVISFLGFGYHQINLIRLTNKIKETTRIIRGEECPLKVYGTAFDLDAATREFVESHISGITLEQCKIDQMFKKHNILSVRHGW